MRVLARLEDNRAEAVLRAVKQNSVSREYAAPKSKVESKRQRRLITTGCPITAVVPMSANGTLHHFAAAQQFGRIWSEADINHTAGFMSTRP
jgi:hypothetical protein